MGTNDAWDKLDVAIYKAHLQRVIDSCKAHHIDPVISRLIATDSTKVKWQVTPEYLAAIDSLTSKNGLFPGPDFYTYFRQHPTELNSDGVHPSPTGAASIQRLWAEKMDSVVYQKTAAIALRDQKRRMFSNTFSALSLNNRLVLKTSRAGTASVFSINGKLAGKISLPAPGSFAKKIAPGFYLIRFVPVKGAAETIPVMHR
jgi:hypothetical protein